MGASFATLPTHLAIGRYFEMRERYQAAAALSVTVGVPDRERIKAELGTFLERIEFVDRRVRSTLGYSLFWRPDANILGAPLAPRFHVVEPGSCAGALDRAILLPGPAENGASLLGWAWDYRDRAAARDILIVDDQGRVEGLGIRHVPRRDVGKAFSNRAMDDAGFLGYARLPVTGPRTIRIFEELQDQQSVCLVGVPRIPAPAPNQ
jgi:hypothetical protein